MKRFIALVVVLLVGLCSLAAAQNRTYTIEDLLKVRRVGDPQISPDGKQVAFTIGDVNFDANRVVTQIYVTSIEGGGMKQLTTGDRSSIVASLVARREKDCLHHRQPGLGDGQRRR